jgi:hypothetical protein
MMSDGSDPAGEGAGEECGRVIISLNEPSLARGVCRRTCHVRTLLQAFAS